jgi:hypothetical protein
MERITETGFVQACSAGIHKDWWSDALAVTGVVHQNFRFFSIYYWEITGSYRVESNAFHLWIVWILEEAYVWQAMPVCMQSKA